MGNSMDVIWEQNCFLARHLGRRDLDAVAAVWLLELGVDSSRLGFENLKNAVVLRMEDPRGMITKSLYPAVGRLYEPKVEKDQVERTIRCAITDAWEKRDPDVWARFFAADTDGPVKKPTNAEFISRLAMLLEDWRQGYGAYSGEN